MIETDSPGLTRRPFADLTGGDPDFREVFRLFVHQLAGIVSLGTASAGS